MPALGSSGVRLARVVVEWFDALYVRSHRLAGLPSSPSRSRHRQGASSERRESTHAGATRPCFACCIARTVLQSWRRGLRARLAVWTEQSITTRQVYRRGFSTDGRSDREAVSTHARATSPCFAYCIACIAFRDLHRSMSRRLTVRTEQFTGNCRARRRGFATHGCSGRIYNSIRAHLLERIQGRTWTAGRRTCSRDRPGSRAVARHTICCTSCGQRMSRCHQPESEE